MIYKVATFLRSHMNRVFWSIMAVILPWIVFLINDDPASAGLALFLQATGIGWIPASIWAFKTTKKMNQPEIQKKGN